MLPEEKARVKIDKQLTDSGWNIVSRDEYIPNLSLAVKEALMQGGKESDYLLFIDNKAIAVIEAKKEEKFSWNRCSKTGRKLCCDSRELVRYLV